MKDIRIVKSSALFKFLVQKSTKPVKKDVGFSLFGYIKMFLLWNVGVKLLTRLQYTWFKLCSMGLSRTPEEEGFDKILLGYPSNHNYRISSGMFLPEYQLFSRFKLIAALYPDNFNSFFDIGSCKGFFTFCSALTPGCEKSVGIDLHKPFVELTDQIKDYLKIDNVFFNIVSLDQVAAEPEKYKAPYQTAMVINTYHYLYWGSGLSDKSFNDHDVILKQIADVCTDTLIFSNPLEVKNSPGEIRKRAAKVTTHTYTTREFLEAADKYFDVYQVGALGRIGKRPLFVMKRKKQG